MKPALWTRAFPKQVDHSVADRKMARKREYDRESKRWLKGKYCVVCLELGVNRPRKATDIHHRKGRGRFLLDRSTILLVCRPHHQLIHANPYWAYCMGFLLKRGK